EPGCRRLLSRARRPGTPPREFRAHVQGDACSGPGEKRTAGLEIGQRYGSRLDLPDERRVRGSDLPEARLVRVDAGVADLHRVGRTPEREGPGRERRRETHDRDADDWT